MHLLYLHQYFCPPGGSGNDRSLEFAAEWVKAGHKVTLITSPAYFPADLKAKALQNPAEPFLFTCEGIEVISLPVDYSHHMPFMQRIKAWRRFQKKAFTVGKTIKKVDRIWASSTPLTVGLLGMKLAAYHKTSFVFETVDVWPDVPIDMGILKNPVLKWVARSQARRIYKNAKHIVALSDGMKEQIMSHGVPENKITVICNGTNLEKFPFVERHAGETTNVIYTGTIGISNDLTQLIEAASHLEKKGRKDIHFTILGTGNDEARVKRKAAELKTTTVEFKSQVPKEQVAHLLAKAHIGVVCFANHSSLEANSANKFFDYLASGLPVVINYKGWQANMLEQYNCGLSAPQGNLISFAGQIESLADDPGIRKAMGQNARTLAETHFDRRVLALQALSILLK